jgi:hypothetical protein
VCKEGSEDKALQYIVGVCVPRFRGDELCDSSHYKESIICQTWSWVKDGGQIREIVKCRNFYRYRIHRLKRKVLC